MKNKNQIMSSLVVATMAIVVLFIPSFTHASTGYQKSYVSNCQGTGKSVAITSENGITNTYEHYYKMTEDVYREVGYYCDGSNTFVKKWVSLSEADIIAPRVSVKNIYMADPDPLYPTALKKVNFEVIARDSQTPVKEATFYMKKESGNSWASYTKYFYNLDLSISFSGSRLIKPGEEGIYLYYTSATDAFGNIKESAIRTFLVN